MKEIKIKLKYTLIDCLYSVLSFTSLIFKIRENRVLFSSFSGTNYGCNPKYISQSLEKDEFYEVCWVYQKGGDISNYPKNIKLVQKHSLKYIYIFFTSKVIIDNDAIPLYMPVRKEQVFINTWHGGGAFKKTGFAMDKVDYNVRQLLIRNAKKPTFFLSSSRLSSDCVIRADLGYTGAILKTGFPRNDILVHRGGEKIHTKAQICDMYHVNGGKNIILYAPTFRPGKNVVTLDIDAGALCKAANQRFGGDWILMVRSHHRIKNRKFRDDKFVVNVSDYPDMQELCLHSDILITDYSSCMWDFALMYKPCFIFAKDFLEFNRGRGFHYDLINSPFPFANNQNTLVRNFLDFNVDVYEIGVKKFFDDFGSYEDGQATKRVKTFIDNICKGDEDEVFCSKIIE